MAGEHSAMIHSACGRKKQRKVPGGSGGVGHPDWACAKRKVLGLETATNVGATRKGSLAFCGLPPFLEAQQNGQFRSVERKVHAAGGALAVI